MSSKPKTADDLHAHFKRRVLQRFSAIVGDEEIERLEQTIRDGDADLVERRSHRLRNYLLEVNCTALSPVEDTTIPMLVGYDSNRGAIVTAMYPDPLSPTGEEQVDNSD